MASRDERTADPGPFTQHADGVSIQLRVQPRASRDAVVGLHEGAVKIALTAPPVDGEANDALIAFLARRLGVPRRDVVLERGASGRTKCVRVRGATLETVRTLLEPGR